MPAMAPKAAAVPRVDCDDAAQPPPEGDLDAPELEPDWPGDPEKEPDELIEPDPNAPDVAPAPDPELAAKYQADSGNYLTYAGGVAITVGTEVIGAVGVSGAEPSEKDEACAMDGVKAVQSMLK